jgi:hypothetical protein
MVMKSIMAMSIVCSAMLLSIPISEQKGFAADVDTIGNLSVQETIESTTGGIKFPDDSIQTKACSGCANGILAISLGGTGANNALDARNNLGVPGLIMPNTFTASQTIQGEVSTTRNLHLPATTATTGIIYSGSSTLMHTYGTENFFAGLYAGNLTMTWGGNTASGFGALYAITTGNNNTASGSGALASNTTASQNTAIGTNALYEQSYNGGGTTA